MITLLALTILVGLIFYVYNTGDVVNRRMDLQTSADAAAISGASWLARSMNVVAMDNVGMSRVLSAVVVLDSLPLASEMALSETTSWEQALQMQLDRGLPNAKGRDLVKAALESLRQRMADERDILQPVDQAVNHSGFDMALTTHWAVRGTGGPPPNGTLWQAAVAMDELSQATVESAGVLAQASALDYGRLNDAAGTFLVPILPSIPARHGTLDDFRPVLAGKEYVDGASASLSLANGDGGAIPDVVFPYRLGPWARQFRWRNDVRRFEGWQYVPPTTGWDIQPGHGSVHVGGRRVGGSAVTPGSGRGGYMQPLSADIVGYTTYGPLRWMMNQIDWWANDHSGMTDMTEWTQPGQLSDTFFYKYLDDISRIKLGYMFPAAGAKKPVTYHHPQWVTSLAMAQQMAQDPSVRISQTMFYLVEIASSVPPSDSRYLSSGTFRTNGKRPIAIWAQGWADPGLWTVPRLGDWVWKDSYTYQTTQDSELGIAPRVGPDGSLVYQPVYMEAWYVFGGVDIGGESQISNPCNWSDGDILPAPTLLDTTGGDYDPAKLDSDQGVRREKFTVLAACRQGTIAPAWPKRFATNKGNSMVSLAQAKIFNNTSWDLWTQDWQAQLTPVSQWDKWQSKIEAGLADVQAVSGQVSDSDVRAVLGLMQSLPRDSAETYLQH